MKGLTSRRGRKQESRGQPLSPARSGTREEAEQRGGEKRDSDGGERAEYVEERRGTPTEPKDKEIEIWIKKMRMG